jgi:butyryl-CoA dehydrogenase
VRKNYIAPLADIHFALRHVAGIDQFIADGLAEGLDLDVLTATIESASRFAEARLAPANWPADQQGARYENGVMTTPANFAAIYRDWAANNWNEISAPAEYGGDGDHHLSLYGVLARPSSHAWSHRCA